MTIEQSIHDAVAAAVAPVATALRDQAAELRALRERLAPSLGTLADAARVLRCSTKTVRRMIERGEIIATHAGRSVRIDLTQLRPPTEDDIAAARAAAGGRR